MSLKKFLVVSALGLLARSSSAAVFTLSDAPAVDELGKLSKPSYTLEGSVGGALMSFTMAAPAAELPALAAKTPTLVGAGRPETPKASAHGEYLIGWKAPDFAAPEGWTYEIQRRSGKEPFVTIAWSEDPSFRESSLAEGTYVYRVRAIAPDGSQGPYSPRSLAVRVTGQESLLAAATVDSSEKFNVFGWQWACSQDSYFCTSETSPAWDLMMAEDPEDMEEYDDSDYDYLASIISNSNPGGAPLSLKDASQRAWAMLKAPRVYISIENSYAFYGFGQARSAFSLTSLPPQGQAQAPAWINSVSRGRAPPAVTVAGLASHLSFFCEKSNKIQSKFENALGGLA